MRCKNCGCENEDNLYICQNCGSPLYDEADINDEDSTVEFKKIGGEQAPVADNQYEAAPNTNAVIEQRKGNNNNKKNNDDEDKKKKQLTIAIIVLSVILVAVIAGVIGFVVANNNKADDITTTSAQTTIVSTTHTQSTTKPTTESKTQPPVIQYKVTVRATDGGSVDGGGQFVNGSQIKISATPNSGYTFEGWYTQNGVRVSQSLSYTFTLNEDVVYEAKFEKVNSVTTTNKETTTKQSVTEETTNE